MSRQTIFIPTDADAPHAQPSVTQTGAVFTSSWFNRDTRPLWEKYLLPRGSFTGYCEIGVSEGQSLLWAFDNLLSPYGYAFGIDPYLPKRDKNIPEISAVRERALRNTFIARETGRLKLVERPSHEVLLEWCADPTDDQPLFNAVYIDGSHWAWDALTDIVLAWRLLIVGGVLIVDDTHRIIHRAKPLVRQAVEAFEHCYETKYSELYRASRQRAYIKVQE